MAAVRPARLLASVLVLIAVLSAAPGPSPRYRLAGAGSPVSRVAVVSDSYTTGTDEGGWGAQNWTVQAWRMLARRGIDVSADVAAEGRAGYGTRGDHGHIFGELTPRAVKPDDDLVVFFGSRNDQGVSPLVLSAQALGCYRYVRAVAPNATLLVIGPPWPTADPPPAILEIRDLLHAAATSVGAAFVDPIAERWFVDHPELIGADGVHPTDAGHLYLAAEIAPLIGARLPRPA